jgi:hypothetical protein
MSLTYKLNIMKGSTIYGVSTHATGSGYGRLGGQFELTVKQLIRLFYKVWEGTEER